MIIEGQVTRLSLHHHKGEARLVIRFTAKPEQIDPAYCATILYGEQAKEAADRLHTGDTIHLDGVMNRWEGHGVMLSFVEAVRVTRIQQGIVPWVDVAPQIGTKH